MKHKITSAAEERQRSNPYHPLTYSGFVASIMTQVEDLNRLLRPIPFEMIPNFWLISNEFRGRFKRIARDAHYLHIENEIQGKMPWCVLNLSDYCRRFDDPKYNITKKSSPCLYSAKRNVSNRITPQRSEDGHTAQPRGTVK